MIDLRERMTASALVFRGYNTTNLGRTAELLAHPRFGPILEPFLVEAGNVAGEVLGAPVDLVARVCARRETDIDSFGDAVALIVAVELAQLQMLKEVFGVDWSTARMSFGYSLGEITAVIAGGMLTMRDALRVPLSVAQDCAQLARDCTLAVLFSRGAAIDADQIARLCLQINQQGRGLMGISAILSPNSLLLHGQHDTLDRLQALLPAAVPQKLHLRKNDSRWPPLHTPIVWLKAVPNRSALLMQTMPVVNPTPTPPVLSLVTGAMSYTDLTARELLADWVDHPQRLWDAVYETCAQGVERVIHVGPAPNLVPATFTRLADNVRATLSERTWTAMGLRAMARAANRPWLAKMLPHRTPLLRAPLLEQINLEDWLLEQRV